MGDKTQLLALLLAARYRCVFPILAGMFLATILNHCLAAELGYFLASYVPVAYLTQGLGVIFIIIGLWTLVPDKVNENMKMSATASTFWPIFWLTLVMFFLAEMGDKTQVATAMLSVK